MRLALRGRVALPLWGLLGAALLTLLPSSGPALSEEWIPVAPGVDYRLFELGDPNRVHVARLSLASSDVIVESSLASGELSGGFETVSEMAERYDDAVIAWGGQWGPRARVLVAINGSSFDSETGRPYGGTFQSGWYAEEYGDRSGGTGFVWTTENRGLIRGCVEHKDDLQVVTRLATGDQLELGGVNLDEDSGLILYTLHYAASTPQGEGVVEAVLRVDQPIGVIPLPSQATAAVLEVHEGSGGAPLLFDQIVLAASGGRAAEFLRGLIPGEPLGISRQITDLGFGCRREGSVDWSDVYSGIGGGFVFLRDGSIQTSDEVGASIRDPRTAVCLDGDFVYFVVVDGRKDDISQGMTLKELGDFCLNDLHARWGVNQDGGGSSAMWVDGRIVNQPSDGRERWVANGLMMVSVEPAHRSNRFDEGFGVTVQLPAEIRSGPGLAFPVVRGVTAGEQVRVVQTALGLRGVFSAGSYWWKVETGQGTGFLAEQSLVSPDSSLAWIRLPAPVLAVADR
jgi:hypothetical protein